ncbi:YwgA family protein [Desulfofundulus thermocisternus]|uniref:YwgA family protein n=1 Tax=Desulfofundulus thermocisternus TaxID=42471 RepID=UPI00217EA862|nr:hypothetical protein [Desulfofundulus thermocisternus]MCS5695450.1 hypothetical protein [Desulfofundulus thermocisternus]
MDILKKYLSLIKLLDAAERINGRKKLQKIVYLLKERGFPFEEDFDYHRYGPFSEKLAMEVEEMKFLGIIEEKVETTAFGYKQYVYCLSPTGRELSKQFDNHDYGPGFKELVSELCSRDARNLELIATLRFLKTMNYQDSDVARYVKLLKPEQNYNDAEINTAINFLNKIFPQ